MLNKTKDFAQVFVYCTQKKNKQRINNKYLIKAYLFLIFRHNDLPWNIRKFIHNKLNTVNFTSNLKTEDPWGTSPWSHTDLTRLVNGRVGGQVWFFLSS